MRNKRVFMLMIGFLVCIILIGLTIGGRGTLTLPEKVIRDSVGFTQQLIYRPVGAIAGFFKDIKQLNTVYEENERLRLLAAAYARDKAEYNFIKSENERLKIDLNFTSHQMQMNDYKYLIAQVISVSNDANNRTININLGSKHGVEKDMAVITVDGLVGLVKSVSPYTASVTPFTELKSTNVSYNAISATIEGRDSVSFGILTEYNPEIERIMMTKIGENDPMAVGDTVITSGSGNVYPRGLKVGTVESLKVGDFGLTYVATINPFAKLNQLTEVFVVQIPKTNEAEDQE